MTNYYDQIAGPNLLGYQDDIPSYFNAILAENSELTEAVKTQLSTLNLQDNAELVTLIVSSAASAIAGSFGPVGIGWDLIKNGNIALWNIDTNNKIGEIILEDGYTDEDIRETLTTGIVVIIGTGTLFKYSMVIIGTGTLFKYSRN